MLKTTLHNRYFQLIIAFVVGGLAATLLLPTKEIIKKEVVTEVKIVEVEKQVIVYRDRIIEKDTSERTAEKTVTRKTTHPDGTIIEETITESTSETLTRLVEAERLRFEELLRQKEEELLSKTTYEKIKTNPKRFHLYAGAGLDVTSPARGPVYVGGLSANMWGPFTVGVFGDSNATLGLTIGVSF